MYFRFKKWWQMQKATQSAQGGDVLNVDVLQN